MSSSPKQSPSCSTISTANIPWRADALCREYETRTFFSRGVEPARAICERSAPPRASAGRCE